MKKILTTISIITLLISAGLFLWILIGYKNSGPGSLVLILPAVLALFFMLLSFLYLLLSSIFSKSVNSVEKNSTNSKIKKIIASLIFGAVLFIVLFSNMGFIILSLGYQSVTDMISFIIACAVSLIITALLVIRSMRKNA